MSQPVELRAGSGGQFDVLVDGQVLVSKEKVALWRRLLLGGSNFPDHAATAELIRQHLVAN